MIGSPWDDPAVVAALDEADLAVIARAAPGMTTHDPCPALFYRTRCELPAGHASPHRAGANHGDQRFEQVWTDPASDTPRPE